MVRGNIDHPFHAVPPVSRFASFLRNTDMDPAIFTSSHLVSHKGADQCNANSLDNDNEKHRKKKEDGKKGVNSSGVHRHVP